jgi:uncharacterized protein
VKLRALLVFLLAFFVAWTLRATVLYFVDESIPYEFWRGIYSNFIKALLWVVPTFSFVKIIDRRSPLKFCKLITTPLALPQAFLLTIGYFTVVLCFAFFVERKNLSSLFSASLTKLSFILAGIIISPLLEEFLFRGFVLNKLREELSFWLSNLISALLFSAAHWPYWLWSRGFTVSVVRDSASVFLLGAFLGYLVRLTNSLWPAVGAHICNNFLVSFLRN